MTALSKTLGRSLLLIALSSSAFACGDDDGGGGGGDEDAGPTAGTDGGGSSGTGGSGGTDGGGEPVSVAQCVTDAKATTMNMTSDACLMCACEDDTAKVTACDANCWALIACFGGPCADVDTSDMAASVSCIVGMCPNVDLATAMASAGPATALGMTLSGTCSAECASAAGDAGPDTDAGGDTDGGS